MYSETTDNIRVNVVSHYESLHSDPSRLHFVFSYTINIKNKGNKVVQLLKRYWLIKSADGIIREVEGDGVVGEQPILQPEDSFQYSSWAPITCEIGEMSGNFVMKDINSKEIFKIIVPKFPFVANPILN